MDFASAWVYIRETQWWWFAIAAVTYTMGFILRGLRWKYLLSPVKEAPASKLFSYLIIGFFMNNVFPLRLGELIRAHITGQKIGVTRSGALATIVVERLFDGLTYVVLFLLTVLYLPFPEWAKRSLVVGSCVFLAIVIFLFFVVRHRNTAIRLFNSIPLPRRFTARIQSIFANFIGGLQVFGHARALSKALLLSLCIWTIEGFVFLLVGTAFHLPLNLFQCFFCMIIIGMGAILPTAPGYVGTVEFLGVTSLSFLGVNKNLAFGFILTLHVMQLLLIALMGIRSLLVEKITFSELIHIEKQNHI